jgi:hypothetical protein
MSIAQEIAVQNMQKTLKELLERPTPDLTALEKRVDELENKYKMLNARVGWNKDKAA